jgi:hypothetical protein
MFFLHEFQQDIEISQLRWFHDDVRRGRQFGARLRHRDDGIRGQWGIARQQDSQGIVHCQFAGVGRVLQDFQVLLCAGPLIVFFAETIVSQAEPGRGKQVFAIGIVRERAWLADQRIDDVPVVDRMAVPAHQSR